MFEQDYTYCVNVTDTVMIIEQCLNTDYKWTVDNTIVQTACGSEQANSGGGNEALLSD